MIACFMVLLLYITALKEFPSDISKLQLVVIHLSFKWRLHDRKVLGSDIFKVREKKTVPLDWLYLSPELNNQLVVNTKNMYIKKIWATVECFCEHFIINIIFGCVKGKNFPWQQVIFILNILVHIYIYVEQSYYILRWITAASSVLAIG